MKLKKLLVRNFRCCESLVIDVGSMHALVGTNNAGKSTVLHALDFLFNPSSRKLSEETFFHRDQTRRIEIEGVFEELTTDEKRDLSAYIKGDGTFHVMRTAEAVGDSTEADAVEGDAKYKIQAHYAKSLPKIDWLNPTKVSGAAITEWWRDKESLAYGGNSFVDFVGGTKPPVATWKDKANEFAKMHLVSEGDYQEEWVANPQGYSGVLKSTLPHYELIPAVRDALDESRVTKTNPFGRLIYEIVNSLDVELRAELEVALKQTVVKLNRGNDGARAAKVAEIEDTIKGFLGEIMPVDLELQFQAPTVEVLLTTPKVMVDDGFSGGVDGKGHGLQRAVIFSILRAYAKLVTQKPEAARRTLILGVEEPELYMHPTAQRTIRKVLRTIADGGDQVFITTHSPLMVDVEFFDEVVRIEAAPKSGGSPKPYQLPVACLIEDLVARNPGLAGKVTAKSIREKYRHVYTASRNEGFFAKTVVLVEGPTELYALPVYAQAAGFDFDALSIAVVECGGKGQIDRLYRVFNELGIPCYVIFDYDLGTTDKGLRRDTVELIKLLRHESLVDPREAVVTPTFACFSRDWEADVGSQIDDYQARVKRARADLGAKEDSKPSVARFIALELTAESPPKVPKLVEDIVGRIVAVSRTASCLTSISRSDGNAEVAVGDEINADVGDMALIP